MAFEIQTYGVEGNTSELLDNNTAYYSDKMCCYVNKYLKFGRRDEGIEQEIHLGVMVMDFYQRFDSTEDILGVDNSNVFVDGWGLAEIQGVD